MGEPAVQETISHYRILEKVGEGGMGVVYRATDTKLGRVVALKVVSDRVEGDTSGRSQLLKEARAAASISHSSIATVFEVGEDAGRVFIAMEFVEGETLKRLIDRGPIALRTAVRLAREIAAGLAAAHKAGVIHRDVKPMNAIVTADGHVKLLDFGLARINRSRAAAPTEGGVDTVTIDTGGRVFGTPGYMSPEQARGEALDQRSDVFSFGVVLYEMMTGKTAFGGTGPIDRVAALLRDSLSAASSINAEVPPAIDRMIARCTAKSAGDRYSSFAEVLAELEAVTIGDSAPSSVAPLRASIEDRRGQRRRWLVVAALGVAGGAAAVAITRHHDDEPVEPTIVVTPQPIEKASLEKRRLLGGTAISEMEMSPDGTALVFLDATGVFLVDVASGRRRQIPKAKVMPGWMPDSKRLVISIDDKVQILNVASGATRTLFPGRITPRVSPDGKRLAFTGFQELVLVDLDGTHERRIAANVHSFVWSPDGRRIAVMTFGGGMTLATVDVETGIPIAVTSAGQFGMWNVEALAWLSTGELVYQSIETPRIARAHRVQIHPDGSVGQDRTFDLSGPPANVISAARVGSRVAYVGVEPTASIQVGQLVEGGTALANVHPVAGSRTIDRVPITYLSDGRLLAAASQESSRQETGIELIDLSTGAVKQIVPPPWGVTATIAPDRSILALRSSLPSGSVRRWTLLRGSSEGGALSEVDLGVHPSTDMLLVRCEPGCLLIKFGGRRLSVRELDPKSGPYGRDYDTSATSFSVPMDRAMKTGLIVDGTEILRWEFATGKRTSIFHDKAPHFLAWARDERSFYGTVPVAGPTSPLFQIQRFTLDGKSQVLYEVVEGWLEAIAIAPDGKSLAFGKRDFATDIWVAELPP